MLTETGTITVPVGEVQPPPETALMQMLFGKMIVFSLGAVARLGIADHMTDEHQPVSTIALACGTREDALYRVLRMLSVAGVFSEGTGRTFALTPVGRLLRRDAHGSLRNMAIMFSDEWSARSYAHMDHSLRTGQEALMDVYGGQMWEVLRRLPSSAEIFARAMTDFTNVCVEALLESYDFSRFHTLADVAGSQGALLSAVLRRTPGLCGVLFDLPEIIQSARKAGLFQGCEHRVRYEAGDMFAAVPQGCDAYLMKHIAHDWDDGSCVRILRLMRDQLATNRARHGRVFLYEMLIHEDGEPGPAPFLDIEMLTLTHGGRERTATEIRALFNAAGLELERITTTRVQMHLLEARVG